jgi:hypothetical protein
MKIREIKSIVTASGVANEIKLICQDSSFSNIYAKLINNLQTYSEFNYCIWVYNDMNTLFNSKKS